MNPEEQLDKELYKNYLNGDNKAFEQLVIKYKNQIIFFISGYTKDISIAEDISQDVFVYILLNKEKYDFQYSFKTYIFMIAKCRAINYIKREKKVVSLKEVENFTKEDKELEAIIYKNDNNQMLNKKLKELKPDYQAVIYLSTFEKMKYKDIAKVMNKNIGQVKSLLNRAKKKLKKLLEEEGMTYEG